MTSRLTTILAAVGASGALVAGGLAFGGSPASAATIPFTYNCSTPLGAENISLAFDPAALAQMPATWTAGVPMGLEVDPVLTLPAELTTAIHDMLGYSTISGTVAAAFGDSGVPVTFTVPDGTPVESGKELVVTTPGVVGAPTKTGTQAIGLPSTLNATLAGFAIPCQLTSTNPGALGSIDIASDSSTTTAKAAQAKVKAAKSGKAKGTATGKVLATVKAAAFQGIAAAPTTGKVIAKEGAKTLATGTLKGGKATLTLKKLKVGKHKIVVSYAGANGVKGSSAKPVTITVTK